jgi:hypothetical protein
MKKLLLEIFITSWHRCQRVNNLCKLSLDGHCDMDLLQDGCSCVSGSFPPLEKCVYVSVLLRYVQVYIMCICKMKFRLSEKQNESFGIFTTDHILFLFPYYFALSLSKSRHLF